MIIEDEKKGHFDRARYFLLYDNSLIESKEGDIRRRTAGLIVSEW